MQSWPSTLSRQWFSCEITTTCSTAGEARPAVVIVVDAPAASAATDATVRAHATGGPRATAFQKALAGVGGGLVGPHPCSWLLDQRAALPGKNSRRPRPPRIGGCSRAVARCGVAHDTSEPASTRDAANQYRASHAASIALRDNTLAWVVIVTFTAALSLLVKRAPRSRGIREGESRPRITDQPLNPATIRQSVSTPEPCPAERYENTKAAFAPRDALRSAPVRTHVERHTRDGRASLLGCRSCCRGGMWMGPYGAA